MLCNDRGVNSEIRVESMFGTRRGQAGRVSTADVLNF